MKYILPLNTDIDLENGGGKAANLSILFTSGFNVPDGFVISTHSYWAYVESNKISELIKTEMSNSDNEIGSIENASKTIREKFRSGLIPENIGNEILDAFHALSIPKVAVRSSATAEDLPEASFAGQQDTFLNTDEKSLLVAVIECWSSLWTPRAIGYRNKNGIDHSSVSLAVVVQGMVNSETSGVLFTANPLTGNRTETLIDATFGLGEALVSGQIEPDNYIVDTESAVAKKVFIGSKGGENRQTLTNAQISELTRTSHRIQDLYNSPQDIEWAYQDGMLSILQSRPITGLFPVLEDVQTKPFRVFGSINHVQGVMSPITPMGIDVLSYMIYYCANRVGSNNGTFLAPAGGRIYTNMTSLVQNKKYHPFLDEAFVSVEPVMKAILDEVKEDPRLINYDRMPSVTALYKIARTMIPLVSRAVYSILTPESSRRKVNHSIEEQLQDWRNIQENAQNPLEHLKVINTIYHEMPRILFPSVLPRIVAGIGSFMLLKRRAESLGLKTDALNIARGLPHNVTTEMDLSLWEKVQLVKQDPSSEESLRKPIPDLADAYSNNQLHGVLKEELDDFLGRYGMRGADEIDIGVPRWRDDPKQIIQTMQSYLDILPDKAPDKVFMYGFQSAEKSRERIIKVAKESRGWLFGKTTELACRSQRSLAGLRETPKFFIIRTMSVIKKSLLSIGASLVSRSILGDPSDVFYLRFMELTDSLDDDTSLNGLVEERRTVFEREKLRRQIPRVITSTGEVYFNSKHRDDSGITGTPVSPGTVEGIVRVLTTPSSDKLNPGEILVCPATDPSWTPLFLVAGGLVMEVGGLMTHGSVVAREYGIPAVVGVRDATTRLTTGQKIRVDGESGVISLIE